LLAAVATPPATSQTNTSTIVGPVIDDTGAVIPGAIVTAKNLGTGDVRTVTTGNTGEFTVPNLQIGHYSVTIIRDGFASAQIADTELQVAQRATLNPILHVGGVNDKVTVIADQTPLLNQASSSVGQVIDTQTVQNMPLNGRTFWQLTQLTPGVSYIQGGQNIATGGTSIRASAVNVNIMGSLLLGRAGSMMAQISRSFSLAVPSFSRMSTRSMSSRLNRAIWVPNMVTAPQF